MPKKATGKKRVIAPTPEVKHIDARVINAIALIVTFVWAFSFVADILVDEYQPSAFIHFAFMGLLGGIFGFRLVGRSDQA